MTETQVVIGLLGLGLTAFTALAIFLTNMVKSQRAEWFEEHRRFMSEVNATIAKVGDESCVDHASAAPCPGVTRFLPPPSSHTLRKTLTKR